MLHQKEILKIHLQCPFKFQNSTLNYLIAFPVLFMQELLESDPMKTEKIEHHQKESEELTMAKSKLLLLPLVEPQLPKLNRNSD